MDNRNSKFKKINLTPIWFPHLIWGMEIDGRLDGSSESMALWYYYVLARKAYEAVNLEHHIEYEGDPSMQTNFKQIFKSVSLLYGVKPEHMVKAWSQVDEQCTALNLPKLPDEERFRFNRVSRIVLN